MHKHFLQAALDQAWKGRGVCAPNPSVGAVLVHNQQIVARAFHPGAGLPHAEPLVFAQVPEGLKPLTLYVTLEPCNHWGRTPPCVDLICKEAVERVVYAYRDPNPLVVENDTPSLLQAKGIEVIHYPLPEIDAFYRSYSHWVDCKMPWITAKIAHSLDGKIAGCNGERVHLSNTECAQFTHQQRLYSDVILTTAQTIQADNPLFNVRQEGQDAIKKVIAILDRRLQLTGQELVLSHAKRCHIFYDGNLPIHNTFPHCTYHAVPVIQGKLCLLSVCNILGELGYHDVWVEAGGKLFSALHRAKLVDTTYVYLVPTVLGDKALSAYHDALIFENKHRITWQAYSDNMVMRVDWLRENKC